MLRVTRRRIELLRRFFFFFFKCPSLPPLPDINYRYLEVEFSDFESVFSDSVAYYEKKRKKKKKKLSRTNAVNFRLGVFQGCGTIICEKCKQRKLQPEIIVRYIVTAG